MSRLVVTRTSDDGLHEQWWQFFYHETKHVLCCNGYEERSRPSRRHKFKTDQSWSPYTHRVGAATKPEITKSIALEAVQKFIEGITVEYLK